MDKRVARRGCITGLVGLGALILGIMVAFSESNSGGSNGFGVLIALAGIVTFIVGVVINTRHGEPGDWWGWGK